MAIGDMIQLLNELVLQKAEFSLKHISEVQRLTDSCARLPELSACGWHWMQDLPRAEMLTSQNTRATEHYPFTYLSKEVEG